MIEGNIKKMKSEHSEVVKYFLPIGKNVLPLNELVGKKIEIIFEGKINCIKCGVPVKKTFAQGYCYNCFNTAPETDVCMVSPEKCQAHNDVARDLIWAREHCLQDHFVYLSLTNQVKVGVTRHTNVPFRWIDQGAVKAIKLAKTPYRELAGQIEVDLKKHFSDKTGWQKMLKNEIDSSDLIAEKQRAAELLRNDLKKYLDIDNTIYEFKYPVEKVPQKVKSINLDKDKIISKKIVGIKGQYFIFEDDTVINIRKYNGYYLKINF